MEDHDDVDNDYDSYVIIESDIDDDELHPIQPVSVKTICRVFHHFK